jgi:hypothetical protein
MTAEKLALPVARRNSRKTKRGMKVQRRRPTKQVVETNLMKCSDRVFPVNQMPYHFFEKWNAKT